MHYHLKTYTAIILILLELFAHNASANDLPCNKTIYIYSDEGTTKESISQTISMLKKLASSKYRIRKINAAEVALNKWSSDAKLFIIPGGADLYYVKKLQGQANKNIINYIKNGGSYLGICAGSYYGAAYVEFDKGGKLEVLGKRELAFFPGKAIGPALAKYKYKSNFGARAAVLSLTSLSIKSTRVFYNGGGYFADTEKYPDISVIGYYHNHKPAIIHVKYGNGNVILSGVHFEYNPFGLDQNDQYLKKILPILKNHNNSRIILAHHILAILNID